MMNPMMMMMQVVDLMIAMSLSNNHMTHSQICFKRVSDNQVFIFQVTSEHHLV